ncbi:hypothetical protein L873DRAFT_1675485 [Choiromyces venosus 120613-1]|uniref:NADH dehydrogenase [ubiquinone] 1 beta subcomplex subunit 4 n=1 Tax=Choiromyces venosus 120613-1 TaxID=1336337 RepID=A0A3N4JX95_9PEZI|nr:hypothetical protein L873DRAFT_1675485 [Choiromyces venosus 120613-1]
MAGGHHREVLHQDPAYIKYAYLNTHRYKYFRWNAYTAKISFIYAILIPGALMTLAYKTEGKYTLRGKRRGDIPQDF